MKKWISIIMAAAFAAVSVNAIAQDKKKDGKATAEAKKDDKAKKGDKDAKKAKGEGKKKDK
jgi:hypothetical protein